VAVSYEYVSAEEGKRIERSRNGTKTAPFSWCRAAVLLTKKKQRAQPLVTVDLHVCGNMEGDTLLTVSIDPF
jgi:hypothetical protein